jgi:hypothetical protein
MNHPRKIVFSGAALVIGLAFASSGMPATIQVNSDLVSEGNSETGLNLRITPHPAWEPEDLASFWVSFGNTGLEGEIVPDVPDPIVMPAFNTPSAVFFENFILPHDLNTGSLRVWADDTVRVSLLRSGFLVALLRDANASLDSTCAQGEIACEPGEGGIFDLSTLFLPAGDYELRIEAYQRRGGPFGVLYRGQIESLEEGGGGGGGSVPEPGSVVLFTSGCAGLALLVRRSRRLR